MSERQIWGWNMLELGTPKMPKRNDEETHEFLGPEPIQCASVEFFLAIESFSSPGLGFSPFPPKFVEIYAEDW